MKRAYFLTLILFLLIGKGQAQKFQDLFTFTGPNGLNPWGSLTLVGKVFYGTAESGGAHNLGCIFSIDTDGTGYKDLFDFAGNINGAAPENDGPLVYTNGRLYGTAFGGGVNGDGVVFSIDTNGAGYKDLYDFDFWPHGAGPSGSLIISGSRLYGVTVDGGTGSNGVVFSIDTDGTAFKVLFNCGGTFCSQPSGSLTLIGNRLYGMGAFGGVNYDGTVFSIDTDGTGYKSLIDFNKTNGAAPLGSLTLSGGILYGMTSEGGINDNGCVFSIDTNGGGFKNILYFNDTNGHQPISELTLSGGKLYGMASEGGASNNGCVFSIDTNGSSYTKLLDFNGTNGGWPIGGLTLLRGQLYGMTVLGGINNYGVIFRTDTIPSCVNNYDQTVCIVLTDTALNKNVIIWGRNNLPTDSTHSFVNIYDSTASGWVKIATVSDTSLSEYIDTASNPNTQSYSYKISTVDSCGESSLSATNSTIYLQVAQFANRDSLYWSPYVGFATPHYLIYRGLSLNALTLIDSVSGGTFNFVDTLPPAGSMYLVEAVNPSGGCVPTHRRIMHSHESASTLSLSNGGVPKKLTGIARITSPLSSVRIIPNPNNGRFDLSLSYRVPIAIGIVSGSQAIVEVYNAMGEKVYEEALRLAQGDNLVDLSSQSNGVYLYRVITETGDLISQGKFIIQK